MDKSFDPIDLAEIRFSYPSGRPVFSGADFQLKTREKVGLIGPNGSGKSTLLHIIMGLLRPLSGTVSLFGHPVRTEAEFRQSRSRIGLLFQNADDQLFSPTVLEDVAFGLLNMGVKPAEARLKSMEMLEKLDLLGFEDRVTHRLSGGEKKLVALATVLVMEPEVLLLDEPTTGLDEKTNRRIIEILNDFDMGVVIVSHEYDFLARTTRNIYCMKEGKIIYNGASSSLHSHYHIHEGGVVPHAHGEEVPHSHEKSETA
jgi:cobalt/nickel transport system ATP-binding protein